MKVIIAGGRDYIFNANDIAMLRFYNYCRKIGEIVSGCASGADKEGELFAKKYDIPIKQFPADWKIYGKSAGPIRNKQMAKYADAVILFPGGKGTDSMRRIAKEHGLKILYDAEAK